MAAIAPSRLAVVLLVLCGTVSAQQAKAIEQQVARVGTALSAGNPEEAMTPFDKSFDNYSRLRDYFSALTEAYAVTNELDVVDEEIAKHEATITVHWTMTLTEKGSGFSENREQDLTFKLIMDKNGWRLVGLSPLEFFNPELRKSKK
jgi:hypothetical protein